MVVEEAMKCQPIQPVFQVMAMSRSGHHAFIEWAISRLGGTCVHHNHVRGGVPAQSFLYRNGNLVGETFDAVPDGAWETANVENLMPSQGKPFPCKIILFIRDVYNCMASRIKANKGLGVDVWIAQAREALRITKFFANPVVIKYNEWRDSVEWNRESVAYNRGSSFGSIQGTDERYKLYLDDPVFRAEVVLCEDAARLNEQLFGWRLP